MAEVLRNSSSPVYHQIFYRGAPTDSDALPIVKVYNITETPEEEDPGLTQLLTTITSEKDETNVGMYVVYLPNTITDDLSTLRLVWQYNMSGETIFYANDVSVVMPYTDLSQACMCLGISTDPSDPTYKSYRELAAAERYARQRIENYTGQQFFQYKDVYRVLGSDSDILPLPEKIQSLDRLYMNDIILVDNLSSPVVNAWGYDVQVSETNFGIRINRANMLDNTVYVANGMVPPSINDGSGVFRNNVMYEVHGTFGWKKVPDKVDLATIELMKDFFAKDIVWKNQYVQNIQTFDWQFEYNPEAFLGTGNAYADRLLADFVVNKASLI